MRVQAVNVGPKSQKQTLTEQSSIIWVAFLSENPFDEFLNEQDRENAKIIIRTEMRRFRKPVTIIEGIDAKLNNLGKIARVLKGHFATGGTVKGGLILLQGDHRNDISAMLTELGFKKDSMEIQ